MSTVYEFLAVPFVWFVLLSFAAVALQYAWSLRVKRKRRRDRWADELWREMLERPSNRQGFVLGPPRGVYQPRGTGAAPTNPPQDASAVVPRTRGKRYRQ